MVRCDENTQFHISFNSTINFAKASTMFKLESIEIDKIDLFGKMEQSKCK